jgi:uncharacterized protein
VAEKAKISFALDSSLGKLAKWLRILGFDSVYVPGNPEKSFLFYGTEGRILLTRTSKIQTLNPGHHLLFIRFNNPRDQLHQVISDLKLNFSDINPFSRCIRCNVSLHEIPKEQIRSFVPDYVYETQNNFRKCPACNRIYWPGTHVDACINTIHEIFEHSSTPYIGIE